MRIPRFFPLLLAALAASACEVDFDPLAPSDLQYSVFGYLDASADSQWIRIMPIRQLVLTEPDSFGLTVTLEHLGTGRVVELRDSLFRFTHHLDPELGSDGIYTHNYWTTEPIEPGATYRLTIRRDGAAPAEATVQIPHDYQIEVWLSQWPQSIPDVLRLSGLPHVAWVTVSNRFRDSCGVGVVTSSIRPRPTAGDLQSVPMSKVEIPPRDERCGAVSVGPREISVIGSQTAWPFRGEQGVGNLGHDPDESNITNSIGFVGGGLTKVVPYEDCEFQGGFDVPIHCELRYDERAAGLHGTVEETLCGNGPIDEVTVELREIDGEPAGHRKVRHFLTNVTGRFAFGALEPGVRYTMLAHAPRIEGVHTHTLHTDTLVFEPGEERPYDIGMQQLNPCGFNAQAQGSSERDTRP